MDEVSNTPFRVELIRKAIHFCSLSIPILYYSLSKSTALAILLPVTAAFIAADFLRHYHPPTEKLFHSIFGILLREHEADKRNKALHGGTYMLVSAAICILIFPKLIVITSFAILIIGDSAAALIGRRFGKHKIPIGRTRNRSYEGSLGFFCGAAVVVFFTPKLAYLPGEYIIGIVGGFVGMLAEIFSSDIIDDNLAIPVGIGVTMWLLYLLFFPALNVYQLDR
jgi:dolichol kinase